MCYEARFSKRIENNVNIKSSRHALRQFFWGAQIFAVAKHGSDSI